MTPTALAFIDYLEGEIDRCIGRQAEATDSYGRGLWLGQAMVFEVVLHRATADLPQIEAEALLLPAVEEIPTGWIWAEEGVPV